MSRQQIVVSPQTLRREVMFEKYLIPLECATCQIDFAIGADFMARRRNDKGTFYCPNGHSNWFPGDTEAEKLRKELERTERQLEWSRSEINANRLVLETERRRTAAYKGQLTKLRRRVANGVCPVGGCKRSFDADREATLRHLHNEHEHWVTEHAKLVHDAGLDVS